MTDERADIDYGEMMHDAMRGLIARVLTRVSETGLPGEHHFFVSFDTAHPGVQIAPWLRERYPAEMTIVLQHWFDQLTVDEDGFGVTLNFGDAPERLEIPWGALQTFVDPSVEFGLRFEGRDDGAAEPEDAADAPEAPFAEVLDPDADGDPAPPPRGEAEVVSLDQFRKT